VKLLSKNYFIQVGNVIINKSKIINVELKRYNDEDTCYTDILINYICGKEKKSEIITLSVSYLPEGCDDKGRPCEGLDEFGREVCSKCKGAIEFKKAAFKEINKLTNEKLEELKQILSVDIINNDESTSFILTENGPVKQ
jgi:hypothetical protein